MSRRSAAETGPIGPVPRAWGAAVPGGGRAAHVEGGIRFAGTTSQVCGLFPFAVSSGAAVRGVPIGRHLLTAEPVGLDPAEWLRAGLVSNPGVWVQGQPGIGKSALVKRMISGLVAFGGVAVIPGDVKGEYSALVEALGGSVWRLGRGAHALNPLDGGPLRAAVSAATGEAREALAETLRIRRAALLEALVGIVRRAEVRVTERRLLGVALDLAVDATASAGTDDPLIPDVLAALASGAEPLHAVTATSSESAYRRAVRDLVNTLALICDGPLRGIFDRPSTVTATLATPALSLDVSALEDDGDDVLAAAMLCSWAWSAALIDGTRAERRGRTVALIQDELWRALRVAPGLVERSDRITRLNRHRGVVSFQVTHSLDDLEALPTAADRAKARGLVARNGVQVLGGMVERELDGLRGITPLSAGEAALVTSWAAPPTWVSGALHPGRGKYLIKSGERVGLPVALRLTPSELRLYDTDRAFALPPTQPSLDTESWGRSILLDQPTRNLSARSAADPPTRDLTAELAAPPTDQPAPAAPHRGRSSGLAPARGAPAAPHDDPPAAPPPLTSNPPAPSTGDPPAAPPASLADPPDAPDGDPSAESSDPDAPAGDLSREIPHLAATCRSEKARQVGRGVGRVADEDLTAPLPGVVGR